MSKKAQDASPGTQLDFVDVSFVVKDRATGKDKWILNRVSGTCKPGRLFAMMGGSGAGKTTLLDILACNSYGGNVHGHVLTNWKRRNAKEFAKISCYVTQKDLLYASATVRECVTFSALLRLPMSMSLKAKKQRVEEVLKELELCGCADTLIGDDIIGIKGISGGQKRRVSLAIELVKDPAVIFADEPTSGLDSEVALSIMDALLMLARKQRTVVCTIHQPNSDLTDMFDDFMLLAGGRCAYHGAWCNAVDWFAQQGFKTPTYKNPTDFFMSVVKDASVASRLADVLQQQQAASHAHQAAEAGRCMAVGTPQLPPQHSTAAAAAPQQQPVAADYMTVTHQPPRRHPAAAAAAAARLSLPASASATIFMAGYTAGSGYATSVNSQLPPQPAAAAAAAVQLPSTTVDMASLALERRSRTPLAASSHQAAARDGAAGGAPLIHADVASPWPGVRCDSYTTDASVVGGSGHLREASTSTSASASTSGAPTWYQVGILSQRMLRNWFRSPVMLASEFVQYIFISIFVGLMYMRFTDDADGVYNRAACIWLAFAIMSFTPSYTAVTAWSSERLLLQKELKQQQYGVTSFYLARTLVMLPVEVMQCLVFVAVMYFFVGFQPSAPKFFTFFAVLSLFQFICEGLGLLCALLTRNATYAVVLLTFLLLLMLSFSGFLITKIPVYFVWLNRASFLTYAYTALMQSELTGLMVQDPQNPEGPWVEAIGLMPAVIQNGLAMSTNVGILVAWWGGMELLKLGSLHAAHRLGMI